MIACGKLTNRQKIFVTEYLRDFNATRAARAAGYSARSARSIGQENLTKPDIARAISDAISERAMGTDEVLLRLAEHARGDLGDFLDIGPMGFTVDLEKAQRKGLTHLLKKVKLRTTTSVNAAGIETESHEMEVELYDAQAALVNLAKRHGLFVDQVKFSGSVAVERADLSGLNNDDLEQLEKILARAAGNTNAG